MQLPPRYWSKSWFKVYPKCDVLVNNMSETFNSVILCPRQKPIVTMIEEIRGYLMERWETNRRKIEAYPGSVLPKINKRLEKERELSRFWFCRPAGDNIYEVRQINQSGEKYTVNMNEGFCSCRRWMLTGIPCCHVVTCCNDKKMPPEDLIPDYYRKEAYISCYEPIIFPTNGPNLWDQTPYPDILPPPIRRAPGRPKKNRRKDAYERAKDSTQLTRKGMIGKCRRCRQQGHNTMTCPLPAPPEPTPPPTTETTQPQPTTQAAPNPTKKKGRPRKTQPTTASNTAAVPHPVSQQTAHSGSPTAAHYSVGTQLPTTSNTPAAHSGSPTAAHHSIATQPRRSPRGLSKEKGNATAPTLGLRMKLPTKRAPWK